MDFAGAAFPLSQSGLDRTAALLGVGPAEVWTVLKVETNGCGFLRDRRPAVLFERHVFHRRTRGAHDADPSISSPSPGGYAGGAGEYDRLQRAIALDRTAAIESTSWGIGQIMGFNAVLAGFRSADAMVTAMMEGEDAQLQAMAGFLNARGLHAPLARHDWTVFARGYNGPDFGRNQYDTRLATAFRAFSEGPLPDVSTRQAQVLLMFLGFDPGPIDGLVGKRTRNAVQRFRPLHGLGASDAIDDVLLAALVRATGHSAAEPA